MATPIKSISSAPSGMVIHLFDQRHGEVVERPVVAIGLDSKGRLHPMIIGKVSNDDKECVGTDFFCADEFVDYCRTFVRTDETEDEDELAFSRTIAETIGLVESEDESEDEHDEDEEDEEDGEEPRMSSGDL